MKNISILGSTGSIGTQALDIIRDKKDSFRVVAMSTNKNIDLLLEQIKEFKPEFVCVYDQVSCEKLKEKLRDEKIEIDIDFGMDGLIKTATYQNTELLLTCVVGMIGLLPTIRAIESKIDIALANKETLVVAGDIVMEKARQCKVKILPVDSEHSAIFQCLVGEEQRHIKNLIITASGGAFRGMSKEEIRTKKAKDALKHPNWSMGAKITIDSATMMNKGLEIIEAYHLFGVKKEQIKACVHRQSIVHSMVEFEDNFIKAQMSLPDMRGAISYAFFYPQRELSVMRELDLIGQSLTFEEIDEENFPCISLAKDALKSGGTATCVLNSANEELVNAYLKDEIGFYDIRDVIYQALQKHKFISKPSLDEILQMDRWARDYVRDYLKTRV